MLQHFSTGPLRDIDFLYNLEWYFSRSGDTSTIGTVGTTTEHRACTHHQEGRGHYAEGYRRD